MCYVNGDQYQGFLKKFMVKLSTIGTDETHMPESFMKLFETLRLIVTQGLVEDDKVNYV